MEKNPLRLFISHLSSDKRLATDLAKDLKHYNIVPFVAHEDIVPTAEWQMEIESFINSAHCMLAMLTSGYSSSVWCNQEVGFCFGKGIPIVSLRLGEDPKGFIGKWQGYTPKSPFDPSWEAHKIVELIQKKAATNADIRSWVVNCFPLSTSFDSTNRLCLALDGIALTNDEIATIKNAFENNDQVSGAFEIEKILDHQWIESRRKAKFNS